MKTGCVCDGRYEGCHHPGGCPNTPGGHRSPYFCVDCDKRRIAHISDSLDALLGAPAVKRITPKGGEL
jgi:hypothetical protein